MKLLALCSMVSLSYSRQFLRIEKYQADALAGNLLKVELDSKKLPAKQIVKVLQEDTVIGQPVQKAEQATGVENSTLLEKRLWEKEEAEMGEEEDDGEEDEEDEEMKHQTEAEWLANETNPEWLANETNPVSMTAAAYANQSFALHSKSSDQVQKPECNWQCYLDRYPDLQNAFGKTNVAEAEKHWHRHGKGEKRDCTCDASHCNWQCYLDRYPDLQKAFGKKNVAEAEKHWHRHGMKELRDCTCAIYSTCQTYETAMNDDGGGQSIYLDRHRAVCKTGTAMTGWRLDRGGTHNKYKIVYKCCEHVLGNCHTKKTNLNDDGGHKRPSIYLDRHHPKCNSGQAMQGFRVDRGGTHDKIRINTVCCDLGPTKMGNCITKKTPANDWGNGNTVYLDRHHSDCGYHKIMTGWKLQRPHHHQIQIKYKCCDAPDYKVENS